MLAQQMQNVNVPKCPQRNQEPCKSQQFSRFFLAVASEGCAAAYQKVTWLARLWFCRATPGEPAAGVLTPAVVAASLRSTILITIEDPEAEARLQLVLMRPSGTFNPSRPRHVVLSSHAY